MLQGREVGLIAATKPKLDRTSGAVFWVVKIQMPSQIDCSWRGRDTQSFLDYHHTERNSQDSDNELIVPMNRTPDVDAEIETTERLDGLLRSYRRRRVKMLRRPLYAANKRIPGF